MAVNRNMVEAAFEDWYRDFWTRTSLADFLASRIDKALFACFKVGYTRGYSQGRIEEREHLDAIRRNRLESEASIPRVRQQGQGMERRESGDVRSVVTSRNEEGTASATHIPIVIEGNIALDRSRPVGEYTGDLHE